MKLNEFHKINVFNQILNVHYSVPSSFWTLGHLLPDLIVTGIPFSVNFSILQSPIELATNRLFSIHYAVMYRVSKVVLSF